MATEDAQITLSTSDDPPALVKISRNALIAHSRVFADMLSLNLDSDNNDNSIPVAEKEEELKLFLGLLEGKEAEDILETLSESQWEEVARLADKYDSRLVRKIVETKAWQVEAERGSPGFAFTIATSTGNAALIKRTAERAVLIPDLNCPNFHADQEWKDRLAAWRTVHMALYFRLTREFLMSVTPCRSCHGGCSLNLASPALGQALPLQFEKRFDPLSRIPELPSPLKSGLCYDAEQTAKYLIQSVQAKLSQLPPFPVDGPSFGLFPSTIILTILHGLYGLSIRLR